ncbi:MAG: ATP phosphoribosyltransferase [Rhodospirillales bacterium]|nr:ATP phosphoribosyltransferase [Rhodospirillales bacterium]
MLSNDKLIFAVPRGRILEDVVPMMKRAGIEPEDSFWDSKARQLCFATNDPGLDIVRVRSFDIATMIAFGAAQIGIAGQDVLMEFESREIYAPLDLGVGGCRLVVAEPQEFAPEDDPRRWSHVRIATKYPQITRRHFAARGVHAECVKLNGAMEIAPALGLCQRIVDLTSTGDTLAANGLVEVEEIAKITSRLAVNRTAFKTRGEEISGWIKKFREAVDAGAD